MLFVQEWEAPGEDLPVVVVVPVQQGREEDERVAVLTGTQHHREEEIRTICLLLATILKLARWKVV